MKKRIIIIGVLLLVFVLGLGGLCLFFFRKPNKPNVALLLDDANVSTKYQIALINAARNRRLNVLIKDHGSITLGASKLVQNKKYNVCKGTIKIVRYDQYYEYFPKVDCGEQAEELQFKELGDGSSDFFLDQDNMIVISYQNTKMEDDLMISGDLVLSLYDKTDNQKWSTLIQTYNPEEDGFIEVVDIERVDDYYYALGNYYSYIGDGNFPVDGFYIKLNLKGEFVEYGLLSVDGHDITLNHYIGKKNDAFYYDVLVDPVGEGDMISALMYLDKKGYHFFGDKNYEKLDDYFVYSYTFQDDYIYGLFSDKSRPSYLDEFGQEKYPISLYKMDMNGNIVKTSPFILDRASFSVYDAITVTKNGIYVSNFSEINDGDDSNISGEGVESPDYVVKYDKDLNYIDRVDTNKYKNSNLMYLHRLNHNDQNLLYNFYDDDYEYYSLVGFDDQFVKTQQLLGNRTFSEYRHQKTIYTDTKVIQEYVDDNDNGNIIFATYEFDS